MRRDESEIPNDISQQGTTEIVLTDAVRGPGLFG